FVSVRFSSDALTSKDGEDWAFDMIIRSSEDISVFSASLAMPPGSSLKSTNGAVSSSDGQLMVSWSAGDISTDERAHLRAGYALSEAEMDYLPYLVGALLLLVAIALAFFFLRKKPEPPAPRQEPPKTRKLEAMEGHAVFGMLDETDKEIVREIARQKGKTTQVHLQLYTHVPKATLSRRIASLENKGIIMRSRKGNRNLITLTDIFKKEG
ncbi:MAG TPA: winged helix-turn-helix transcriptional regulator, partial [Chromatiaceae bacterium]|nr:winged helix-turn-helix transcriptional regulator [Chromatiaceae bacterium]